MVYHVCLTFYQCILFYSFQNCMFKKYLLVERQSMQHVLRLGWFDHHLYASFLVQLRRPISWTYNSLQLYRRKYEWIVNQKNVNWLLVAKCSRSSQSDPSRLAHWNPCTIESLTEDNSVLLTSDGSVSSTKIFGPFISGPKAHIDLAASKSQSYLVWKNSPIRLLFQPIETTSFSISSAIPFSKGSAIIVNLFLSKKA